MQLHNAERFPGMGRLRFPKSWRREGPSEDEFLRDGKESGRLAGENANRDLLVDGGAMEAAKTCRRSLFQTACRHEPGL